MLTFWLVLTSALALPPDATPALLDVGAGIVDDLNVSRWGDVVVGVTRGDDSAFLLNVEDWSIHHPPNVCAQVRSVAIVDFDFTLDVELWVGCQDGTVQNYYWDGTSLEPTILEGEALTASVGFAVDGLWYSELNGYLYALYDGPTGGNEIRRFDYLFGLVDDDATYKVTTTWTNFSEGLLSFDQDSLFVYHKGDNVTQVQLGVGAAIANQPGGVVSQIDDIFISYTGTLLGVSEANNSLVQFDRVQRNWQPVLTGLNNPQCVVASFVENEWWLSITGGDARAWEVSESSGLPLTGVDEPYFLGGQNNEVQDGVVFDGYFFGGGTGGRLHINSANPWIEPSSLTVLPDKVFTEGEVVTFGFTASEPGDWAVYLGGDHYGTGQQIDTGVVTTAGEVISVELTVASDWPEGATFLYALLTDVQDQTGHARASVQVDNPPNPPTLGVANIGFADGGLVLSFDGIKDEDLISYEVYVTTTPFDGDNYPTGGPEFDGSTDLEAPLKILADPSASVIYDIRPLENGVRHYVGVRAIDDGGKVGPMSNVISEIPRQVYSAAELAGESGGPPACATTPAAGGWLAILVGGLMIRRRRIATAVVSAVALTTLVVPSAQAAELEKDLTPQRGDIEIRYGGMYLTDPIVTGVYDQGQSNILQLEFGPQIAKMFEADLGVAFFQEISNKVDSVGTSSDQRTMLTWWPSFSLDGTFRLHVIDEQILVPYVRAGFDYVVWSEKSDKSDGTGKDIIRGSKFGNHMGLGLNLLLDPLAKQRASLLEAQTGINDTYLTFEWRRQLIDDRAMPWKSPSKNVKGLNFSGTMFTVGLKLDY